jgi:two-component system NtrC family response regulator
MVEQGHFREDLLYRLRATSIELPPLRQRPEDIKELVFHFADKICRRYDTEAKGVSADFLDALYSYDWPGNVRELANTLEGVIAEAKQESVLFSKHLPTHIRIQVARASVVRHDARPMKKTKETPPRKEEEKAASTSALLNDTPARYKDFRKSVLADAEKKYLYNLISFTKGSIKDACKVSGLGRTRLYNLMKQHNISRYGWSHPE